MDNLDMYLEEKPEVCPACGGHLKYIGLGEYSCEKCKETVYDDYGKVRSFLELHPGANIVQVSNYTGVPKSKIKQLIDSDRLSISGNRPHLNT